VLALLCAAAGCRWREYERPVARRDRALQYPLSRLSLRDGQTGADEVWRILGPPHYRSDDGAFAGYFWDVGTHWAGTPGIQPDDRTLERYVLAMQFDGAGVLRRHRRRRMDGSVVPSDAVESIAREWGVASPVRTAAEAARSPATSMGPPPDDDSFFD
jgi:hypothetical protein